MKSQLSKYSTYPVKVLLIICLSSFGFTSVFNCAAQSVLGRWERTESRVFQIDYSLSEDKLDLNIPLVKNEKTSITTKSIDRKMMI